MTRAWIPLAAWGGLLLGLAAVQLPFGPTAVELALLGGAGAACLLAALAIRFVPPRPARAVPELSGATALLACGVAAMVVGAEAGPWLIGIGAEVFVVGLVMRVRGG
jgi:CHASE2 domain-containing sensor protein